MARFPFKAMDLCKPLAAFASRFDKLGMGARYDILDRVGTAYEAHLQASVNTTLSEESKRLAQQKISQKLANYRNMFERMGFKLSKADGETVYATLLRNPATKGIAASGRDAWIDWQIGLLRVNDRMNDASVVARRLYQSGLQLLSDEVAYLAFANGNAEAINKAVRLPGRSARIKALKEALLDFSQAHEFDQFSYNGKPTDRTTIHDTVRNWLERPAEKGGPTSQMMEDMGELYKTMGELRQGYKDWWIEDFKKSHAGRVDANDRPASAPTEKEIFDGIGGTYGAFMPRIWDETHRAGFIDELIEASNNGVFDTTLHSVRTETHNMAFPQLLRKITSIRAKNPFVYKVNNQTHTFESPDQALSFFFPGLSEARRRESVDLIRNLTNTANDTVIMRVIQSELKDPFYRHRLGVLGFDQSFINSAMAYIAAGARVLEVGPQFAPSGKMHQFLTNLATADPAMAKAMSTHIGAVMGRGGMIDRDMVGAMHPAVRATANAIFLYNPAPAVINVSAIPLQIVPYAMTDGFAAGAKDLIFATSLLTKHRRWFLNLFNESKMGGSFAYGVSTTHEKVFDDMLGRFQLAAAENDIRGAFLAAKAVGMKGGEWLALTESKFVRPFAAAVGLARFYRRNSLHQLVDLNQLPAHQRDEAMRSMFTFIDQSTTIQGGINSPPWLHNIRRIPVVGSMAGMLTVTPVNLFSQFVRDLGRVFDPTSIGNPAARELRGAAFRRLSTQAAAGTILAGPFWFIPMLREMDADSEEAQQLQAFATEFERRYSLAGLLNTELAERLNPLTGVVQRFSPSENDFLSLIFGPLGRPIGDAVGALYGDPAATQRAYGSLAGMADLPPGSVLPSSLMYLAPAGVAGEKLAKMLSAFMLGPSETGSRSLGPLDIPVPTLDGNRIGVDGRPYTGSNMTVGRFVFGGQALDDARVAAEGIKAKKRVDRRASAEGSIRRHLLDGNIEAAVSVITQNDDLDLEITPKELERENLLRHLLPQARAVLTGPESESLRSFVNAAQALETGRLTPNEAKNARHILLAGMIRWKER